MNIEQILQISVIIIFAILLIRYSIGKPSKDKKADLDLCISLLNTKLKQPRKEYTPKKNIYTKFQHDYKNSMNLTALAYDILNHCGFKPASLFVKTTDYLPQENIAGQYKIRGHESTIEIRLKPSITEAEVIAILIHECMHFFLRCRNIGFENKLKNEKLTDVTAIYMGFYKFIAKGYLNTGYISKNEIEYVKKAISK